MSKIRAFSSNFQESAGETSPLVIRKYRLPPFTKFEIVKLEIDFLVFP